MKYNIRKKLDSFIMNSYLSKKLESFTVKDNNGIRSIILWIIIHWIILLFFYGILKVASYFIPVVDALFFR